MKRLVWWILERLPTPLSWWLDKLVIRRRGWTCVELSDDPRRFYWAYTVGFDASLNHPEIVIANRGHKTVVRLFGLIHRALQKGELVIHDGEAWEVCGLPRLVWREVDRSRITTDWFTMAMLHRQERGRDPHGLRVFQLVLPDSEGRLPWELGYCEVERSYTAELWRPA